MNLALSSTGGESWFHVCKMKFCTSDVGGSGSPRASAPVFSPCVVPQLTSNIVPVPATPQLLSKPQAGVTSCPLTVPSGPLQARVHQRDPCPHSGSTRPQPASSFRLLGPETWWLQTPLLSHRFPSAGSSRRRSPDRPSSAPLPGSCTTTHSLPASTLALWSVLSTAGRGTVSLGTEGPCGPAFPQGTATPCSALSPPWLPAPPTLLPTLASSLASQAGAPLLRAWHALPSQSRAFPPHLSAPPLPHSDFVPASLTAR